MPRCDPPSNYSPARLPKTIKREFILSNEADETLNELIAILSAGIGSRLTASQIVRALLIAVHGALPAIGAVARRAGPSKRPGNGAAQARDRFAFERRMAAILAEGLGTDGQVRSK